MIIEIIEIIVIIFLVALLINTHKNHPLPHEKQYPTLQWIWHFAKLGMLAIILGIGLGALGTAIGMPSLITTIFTFAACFGLGLLYPIYPQKIWRKKND